MKDVSVKMFCDVIETKVRPRCSNDITHVAAHFAFSKYFSRVS